MGHLALLLAGLLMWLSLIGFLGGKPGKATGNSPGVVEIMAINDGPDPVGI